MDGEVTSTYRDGETNQRVKVLVGLVVLCAAGILGASAVSVTLTRQNIAVSVLFAIFIAVGHLLRIQLRIGSTRLSLSPTVSAAVLVSTAFLPAGWVTISTAVGVLAVRTITRQETIKIEFNVGKETIAAAAATLATQVVGSPLVLAGPEVPFTQRILAMIAAAFGYCLVEELLSAILFAFVTRTTLRQRATMHLDTVPIGQFVGLLLAVLTVWGYTIQPWLIVGLPFLINTLHLASANQIRTRTEREAWQRLAQATDELNTVDLEQILETAVRRGADLFAADSVEVVVHLPQAPTRMVRGDRSGITLDGPAHSAPVICGRLVRTRLDGYLDEEIGELRLYFAAPVNLSEREQYTMRTFAAALNTAIRNAITFAKTRRLAETNTKASYQDPLTQLPNRLRLHEYGAELLATLPARNDTALLLLDLNHFKEVNETLGHAAGDRLLVEVSHRLRAAAGPDDLVARLGGDEFAVLFSGLPDAGGPVCRARDLLATLDLPVEIDGMSIGIEASGGIASPPVIGGIDELLRRADVAMYQAKSKGQRVAAYARSQDTANRGSLTLGGDLARAISEQQFTLDFQPIVDLASGVAISAEALARWQHPERGCLGPDQFLDGIERSGQLPAFAATVLDQALAAAGTWKSEGFPLDVAVNVSPRSLLNPNFPAAVEASLARHGCPAESLIVELTESVTLSQLKVVDEVLGALRSLGVRLALDDFGTGYSSLSTVARVPVYELKIDRSFVIDMHSPAADAVIRSTIELARSLDLLVVAEGVETPQQRQRLWELGCAAGQGYLFARPMATNRLLPRLRRGADGRPGTLAAPIHDTGSVIRMPPVRRGRVDHSMRRADGSTW